MQDQGIVPETTADRVAVLYINDEMQKVAFSIASMLRLNNIPTDIDLVGRNLKKQMDAAKDAKFAIIVAPKELEESKVVLRNMKDGTESQIEMETLTEDPASVFSLEKP